jgi:hypothetical protein
MAILVLPLLAFYICNSYLLDDQGRRKLQLHAQSLFHLTYRRDFAPLSPYSYTSDTGWGCMLRAAQMLLAQTLRRHFLGAEWRLPSSISQLQSSEDYMQILRAFQDQPGTAHPFCIHHLVQSAMKYDALPGDWWGPRLACQAVRDLCNLHMRSYGGKIAVHVTSSEVVYVEEVEALCRDFSLDHCLLGLTHSQSSQALQTSSDYAQDVLQTLNSRMDKHASIRMQRQKQRNKDGSSSSTGRY